MLLKVKLLIACFIGGCTRHADKFHACMTDVMAAQYDRFPDPDETNKSDKHNEQANNDQRWAGNCPEWRVNDLAQCGAGYQKVKACSNIRQQGCFVRHPGSLNSQIFTQYKILIHSIMFDPIKYSIQTKFDMSIRPTGYLLAVMVAGLFLKCMSCDQTKLTI